jgi:tetratricopeptide (TPR) repeat protein
MAHEGIAEDPSFPGGPLLLAWALATQGRRQDGLVHARRALQLADNATPQERYFILSTVHLFTAGGPDGVKSPEQRRELGKAVAALEALYALQPDHYAVRSNLRDTYQALGRERDEAWMNLRVADARPWSVIENLGVAKQLLHEGNIDGAHRYGARAESSLSPGASAEEPDVTTTVRLFPAYVAWVQDEPNEVLRLLRQAAMSVETYPELERRRLHLRLGAMYAAIGRLQDAARAIATAQPADDNDHAKTIAVDLARAAVYLDAGDRVGLRAFAETRWRDPLSSSAPALLGGRAPYLIEAGLLDPAERHLEWFKRRTSQAAEWAPRAPRRQFQPFYASTAAVIELKRGRREAVDVLRQQLPVLRAGPPPLFGPAGSQTLYAASNVAETLFSRGQASEAISTLEQALSNRVGAITSNTPNQWTRTMAHLASLYRRSGQDDQARAIEARLSKLLAHADADHPLGLQLKARR